MCNGGTTNAHLPKRIFGEQDRRALALKARVYATRPESTDTIARRRITTSIKCRENFSQRGRKTSLISDLSRFLSLSLSSPPPPFPSKDHFTTRWRTRRGSYVQQRGRSPVSLATRERCVIMSRLERDCEVIDVRSFFMFYIRVSLYVSNFNHLRERFQRSRQFE